MTDPATTPVIETACDQAQGMASKESRAAARAANIERLRSFPLEEQGLSVRALRTLREMGILTVGDLAATTAENLLAHRGIGRTTMLEIRDLLADHGERLSRLSLKP